MKAEYIILIVLFAIGLGGCTPSKYKSYADYPVYEGTDLELVYTPQKADFALWSPDAVKVRLNLYTSGTGGEALEVVPMKLSEEGVWRVSIDRDLLGLFYTFQIYSREERRWLEETPGIWAKAVGVNGDRAAIIAMEETNPEGWEADKKPALARFTDIVLYEMHHRDFSISPTSGIQQKGKYLALTESGTRTPEGFTSGIDHLKELGVTHVHLLPSFDFSTVDETRLDEPQYNWGYDPKNYNVPEGSYATDPYDPAVRIREFKAMVKSLHENGLRVVVDVVFNHTYANNRSALQLTAPGYYFRQNADGTLSDASSCGDETASERAMMRRYMIESVKYLAKEYHIDGFCFNLMGIHDIETMNRMRTELSAIDPTIFIYGEGWASAGSPFPGEMRALKGNVWQLNHIAVLGDELRDALKGNVFQAEQAGFASGQVEGKDETLKFAIVGGTRSDQVNYHKVNYTKYPYTNNPGQLIHYVSSHNDLCLVDKLQISVPDATAEELIKFNKLAQTVVFTSQGIPFMRAGEEFHHSKKGDHNSYRSPDSINQLDWSNKAKYTDLYQYYKDLIALRKAHPAFRIPTTKGVTESLRFMETYDPGVVAYTLGEYANGDAWREIVVVFNGNRHAVNFQVPEGQWTVACRNGRINANGLGFLSGGRTRVNASSALILYRK